MNLRLLGIGCLLLLGSALSSCGDYAWLTSSGEEDHLQGPGQGNSPA